MKEFLKKHFENLNLVFVTLLFTLSCVHYVFTFFSLVYLFIVCLFLKSEQIIKIQIILRMFFESILVLDTTYLELVFVWFVVMYLKNWLVDLIFKKQKMNFKLLIVICLMLVLNLFVPIKKTQILHWIVDLSKLLTLYFLYEKRDKLDFVSIVRVFCYSLIVSFVLGYIIGGNAEIAMLDMNIERSRSLFLHPNVLSDYVLMACFMLFAMAYYKKMSPTEYSLLLVANFILGYLTISRNFVLLFVLMFVVFSVVYVFKYRRDGLFEILKFAAIFLSICLLFDEQTNAYMHRVENSFEKEGLKNTSGANMDSGWWMIIFEGKALYDPGRLGLWKLYLMRIFETPYAALFGYGVSAPFIGKMHPHNIVLFEIYQTGIVGFVLSMLASVFIVNWKELKNYKKYLGIFVIVLGYFGDMFINGNNFAFIMVAIIISGCVFVKNSVQTKKEKIQIEREKMFKMLER